MTPVCHLASSHEGLDTRIAFDACRLWTAAGFDIW